MPVTINGAMGPYNPYQPGGFGSNTAYNVVSLGQQQPDVVSTAVIEISPQPHPSVGNPEQLISDAIGYGREEVKQYDQNGDMELDRQEITDIFMGNGQIANQYLKAYDVADENGQKSDSICVKENAAAILMSLNPTKLLTDTMKAFASTPNSQIYSPQQQQDIHQNANYLNDVYPTALKGYTTKQTRDVQYFYTQAFPTFVNETIRGVIDGLDLKNRLAQLFPKE